MGPSPIKKKRVFFSITTAMPVGKGSVPSKVVVHPIVLLSVVDHFNRLSRIGNQRRVVGILLGSWRKGNVVDVATSFAGNVYCSSMVRLVLTT